MRIGILAIQHESNTFLPVPTEFRDFENCVFLRGDSIVPFYQDGHHEISGFIEGITNAGYEMVPLLATFAFPGGAVSSQALAEIWKIAREELKRAGHLDGVLVAPHGAAVSEEQRDMDGWWLSELRNIVGIHTPIIGVIDPHANLTPQMVSSCQALIAYRENPHIDQKQRGLEAALLLQNCLEGKIKPTMSAAYLDLALNIETHSTRLAPMSLALDQVDLVRKLPGVVSASLVMGYPYADVPEMGCALIVVTDDDAQRAGALANRLAAWLWERRHLFRGNLISIETALVQAETVPRPVALLDMGDNMGGGAPADSTILVRLCHERLPHLRTFVCLFDPGSARTAAAAGCGARITLDMGGKAVGTPAPPFVAEVTVRSIHDGRYSESEALHGGWSEFHLGCTAVVTTNPGMTIMLTERPAFPSSARQMIAFGLEPKDFDLIILKGVHSPVGGYSRYCPSMIRVDTPGVTTANMEGLLYRNRRRPLFPFENI